MDNKKENEEERKDKKVKKNSDSGKKSDNQNESLKKVLIGVSFLMLFLIILFWIMSSQNIFKYNGIIFNKIKEGNELTFYKTSIPILYQGKVVPYNIYIRTNPEKLAEEVLFNGELFLLKNAVINMSEDVDCDGDAVIGVVNLLRIYESLKINVIRDENASCDKLGRYMYLNIQESNETKIEQFGPACYNINFKNCEILKATERFLIETLSEIKETEKE